MSPSRSGPAIVTSSKFHYKGLISKYGRSRVRASASEFWARGAQFGPENHSTGKWNEPETQPWMWAIPQCLGPGPSQTPSRTLQLQGCKGRQRLCAPNCASIGELSCERLKLILLIKAKWSCTKGYRVAPGTSGWRLRRQEQGGNSLQGWPGGAGGAAGERAGHCCLNPTLEALEATCGCLCCPHPSQHDVHTVPDSVWPAPTCTQLAQPMPNAGSPSCKGGWEAGLWHLQPP